MDKSKVFLEMIRRVEPVTEAAPARFSFTGIILSLGMKSVTLTANNGALMVRYEKPLSVLAFPSVRSVSIPIFYFPILKALLHKVRLSKIEIQKGYAVESGFQLLNTLAEKYSSKYVTFYFKSYYRDVISSVCSFAVPRDNKYPYMGDKISNSGRILATDYKKSWLQQELRNENPTSEEESHVFFGGNKRIEIVKGAVHGHQNAVDTWNLHKAFELFASSYISIIVKENGTIVFTGTDPEDDGLTCVIATAGGSLNNMHDKLQIGEEAKPCG